MDEFLDIGYVPAEPDNKFFKFDLYVPRRGRAAPLICFIHGGAWRSEDKVDHAELARRLAAHTGYPVAVPNYRLTARQPTQDDILRHPSHAQDILKFLNFILYEWHGPQGLPFDANKIYLMGHSCGAHMLTTIFLDAQGWDLQPTDRLVSSVRAIILSEGIFDIDLLLAHFPTYRSWFIQNAFGDHPSYGHASTSSLSLRQSGTHIRWLIIQSSGDTLVDLPQSEALYNNLRNQYVSRGVDPQFYVTLEADRLTEEHNEVLKGESYIHIVGEYIASDLISG